MLNKSELTITIADKADITQSTAKEALNALTDVITEELIKGNKIQLVGFGTFEVSERAARMGRNPQTGEQVEIPASRVPKFKVGKALKDKVNG